MSETQYLGYTQCTMTFYEDIYVVILIPLYMATNSPYFKRLAPWTLFSKLWVKMLVYKTHRNNIIIITMAQLDKSGGGMCILTYGQTY